MIILVTITNTTITNYTIKIPFGDICYLHINIILSRFSNSINISIYITKAEIYFYVQVFQDNTQTLWCTSFTRC